ncbi:hypothetical protein ACF0H5_006865 [Mactra antiquata]
MPLDTFICGTCMVSFNDIERFIAHKNELCTKQATSVKTESVAMETEESIPVTEVTNLVHIPETTELQMDEQPTALSTTVHLPGSESLITNASGLFQGDNQQTVIILQGDLPEFNLENAEHVFAEVTHDRTNIEMLAGMYKKKGKPGRPRKSNQSTKPQTTTVAETQEKNTPEIGPDGKLLCTRCKKSFTRERVFNAHKCIALSEYVDFTSKEGLTVDPDDNHMPQDDLDDAGAFEDDNNDTEFKVPNVIVKKNKGRFSTNNDENEGETTNTEQVNTEGVSANNDGSESGEKWQPKWQVEGGPDVDEQKSKDTDQISTLPLFLTEEEKLAFEANLNVDLSGVDHMFRVHCIEQELNSNVSQTSRYANNLLSLYSCNTCDKVFKSLSHIRFHVLTHTDLRPFKCIKCDYSSNARGNLYTHIRKHTGQFYKCEHPNCKFKTVNKSHLLEHSMIHSGEKHQCSLCKKHYNTQKSLMSHIRKYHDNYKGREYLATFMQGRDVSRGSTIIHQCHVCNRKFKKKTDRDRHLFVHDIKDIPCVKHCQLCDYSAARYKYLEKHFQKHRCIYRCCHCKEMFLSSIRLAEHLTTSHIESTDTETWEKVFEESINCSLYLPEPDHTLSEEEKCIVNIPTELSESGLLQLRLQNSGEDDITNKLINGADVFINKVPIIQDNTDNNSGTKENVSEENGNQLNTIVEGQLETIDMNEEALIHSEITNTEQSNETVQIENDGNSESEKMEAAVDSHVDKITDGVDNNTETANVAKATEEVITEDIDNVPEATDVEMSTVVEETSVTNEEVVDDKGISLIDKLGYLPMTLVIFQKMRETFGSEECEYCGRLFFSRQEYEPHVKTHTGDKPHICQVCGFRAITQENLKRHIDKDHKNISYPCEECSFIAATRTQLWNHTMKHKGLKGLECPTCQEQFDSIKDLKAHALQVHPNSSSEELDKILSYKHKVHGKLGRRTYKCPHCDKVFFRASSELQKHMWIHDDIKPFKCPLCSYACRSKNNLQAHMLRHSKDKPFSCNECGKAYKSRTALRWHVRSHFGKLFKCTKCPYEATQRSHLKRHMQTHNVIKKYVCRECKFSANTLGFLKVHYARFHKDVNVDELLNLGSTPVEISQVIDTFKCMSCDYLFGNLTDLKRHLKTRHHVTLEDLQRISDNTNLSEVQVVQVDDTIQQPVTMEVSTDGTQSHYVTGENLDEKTASAVNILQQIIGMSQSGDITQQQVDGTSILHPETIIVQQDGNQMFVSADNTTEIDGNQYVIQYIPQPEGVTEGSMTLTEVQGQVIEAEVLNDIQVQQSEIIATE